MNRTIKKAYLPLLLGSLFLCGLSPANAQAETETKTKANAEATAKPTSKPKVTVKPTTKPKDKEVTITISAAGDCTFGSDRISTSSANFYSVYNRVKDNRYFFRKVSSIFKNDDMTIVNLEGTLTNRGERADKKYAFRGKPSYAKILKKGHIEAVSFANNHCKDFGNVSYRDTRATLEKYDISYASYGKTGIYRTKGKRIGMVATDETYQSYSTCKNQIRSGIQKLKKKKVDLIIVSLHSGIEYTSEPTYEQKSLSHYAVKKGANLVLGHHPHVLQGIEKYRGAYIVYSLGNFCFGGNTNPPDKDTMIFQQTFTFKGDKLLKKQSPAKIIPCSVSSRRDINNYQPKPVSGKRYRKILNRVARYSRSLGTSFVTKKGKKTCVLR
ncbi:MAG: CapA family protein [Lachnospiraceae bacterium]|nr:CapA family protein [Lachnospiraceae bacterium]